jgi:outer membrane protein TolC
VLGFGAGVTWNVSPLLSLAARRAAAQEAARSVDLEVGWQEWQVAQAARLHTLRSIYLTRRLEASRDIEESWERRASALAEALLGSAVTALEAAAVERSLGEARLERLDLERELARARVDLAEAIGVDAGAEVQVDAGWRVPADVPALDVLLERLPARRLDLIGLRHAERSRDQLLRAATRARFPPLEIGVRAGRDVDAVSSAGATLSLDLPFFDRNQAGVARGQAEQAQSQAEYSARLAEGRAQVVRLVREIELVRRKLAIAGEVVESSARLAELARQAAVRGGMPPLAAAELEERAATARMRKLEIEQLLAELWVALVTASGTD